MPYFSVSKGWLAPVWRSLGYCDYGALPSGISFRGEQHPTEFVEFLSDLTFVDEAGNRQTDHRIFDEMLAMIRAARQMIILDVFLFNDLLIRGDDPVRPMSAELTNALIAQKQAWPEIEIYFISDPCNTVYGGLPSLYFEELEAAGIPVILTDLDCLRDSNPIYTFLWRLLVRPFGNSPGGLLPNPFGGGGRISVRSFLQIFNIKANHRKTLITDKDDAWYALVSTANPHDASHANRNVGFMFSGPAVADLYHSECAVLEISGVKPARSRLQIREETSDVTVQVVTEKKIKEAVLAVIDRANAGDTIDMILFYLAERRILTALRKARERGVRIRIVLDPNKDAFGWTKTGIPNRPVAHMLNKKGIDIRWADTRGEQCHSKMLCVNFKDQTTTIVLGSANFTRRNLDDFNLETDVVVSGPADNKALADATEMFDAVWSNRDNRIYTVGYEAYVVTSPFQHLIYWFMEKTGISTF